MTPRAAFRARGLAVVAALALVAPLSACGKSAGAAAAWSVVPSPHPSGATSSELDGVSCANATSCVAVGTYSTASGRPRSLVERMTGTRWAVGTVPDPNGAVSSRLDAVSCPTVSFCAAVGTFSKGTAQLTLAARWNGKAWSVVASPNRSTAQGSDNRLTGVSCTSATNCFAIGTTGGPRRTLIERWNGKTWTIVTSPNPKGATNTTLIAVSCADTTHCMATGFWYVRPRVDGGTTTTLVERWNGKTWTIVTSPNPKGATNSTLSGIDCPAPATCVAAGRSEPSEKTLVERWNGKSWTIAASPNPTGASSSSLQSIACATVKRCFAVGQFRKSGGGGTLVEGYDGAKWSVAHTAKPGFESILWGVSCATERNCIAVGTAEVQTLVERYS